MRLRGGQWEWAVGNGEWAVGCTVQDVVQQQSYSQQAAASITPGPLRLPATCLSCLSTMSPCTRTRTRTTSTSTSQPTLASLGGMTATLATSRTRHLSASALTPAGSFSAAPPAALPRLASL